MSLKPDVAKDLLCVIAHGTLKARVPGAHLLFYYWPALNPTLYDRRGVSTKFNGNSFLLQPYSTTTAMNVFHTFQFSRNFPSVQNDDIAREGLDCILLNVNYRDSSWRISLPLRQRDCFPKKTFKYL